MAGSEEQSKLEELQLCMDGETRSFADWTRDFVNTYYPDVGRRCYRVPAIYFNNQTTSLSAGLTFEGLQLEIPDDSDVKGDLAHTLVLDSLEQLGHQLLDKFSSPLFIISSLQYDNYLARVRAPPRRSCKRKRCQTTSPDKSKSGSQTTPNDDENSRFEAVPQSGKGNESQTLYQGIHKSESEFPQAKRGQKRVPQVLVQDEARSGFQSETKDRHQSSFQKKSTAQTTGRTEEQKNQLPPIPSARGEIDVVVLSQKWGVTLIEVKSAGMSSHWQTNSEEDLCSVLCKVVQKAAEQVKRGRDVFLHVTPDLSCPPGMTALPVNLVIALPAVPRTLLEKALGPGDVDSDILFLCKEELPFSSENDTSSSSAVYNWWTTTLPSSAPSQLSLNDLKKIVGRMCGLLSVVSVWTRSKPRVEVRTTAQAISEAGDRISDIVLLPRQASLLTQPSPSRLCVTGNVGSGKTLLLQLKGRQWLQEGRRVVVLTVRTTARGRAVGHVLEEAIRRDGHRSHTGSVERHGVALLEFNAALFKTQLEERGSTINACFLLDEMSSHHVSVVVNELRKTFPNHPIWYTCMAVTEVPQHFEVFRLGACLRSPPSVQLLLKELDLNPFHRDVYTTRSAARGLPCDGPPIIFLQHQRHSTVGRPHDCTECAHELVRIMKEVLRLPIPAQPSGQVETNTPLTQTTKSSAEATVKASTKSTLPTGKTKGIPAAPLSFRDVLILVCMPVDCYEQEPHGWWKSSFTDVLRFLQYVGLGRFLCTLKDRGVPMNFIVDNTSAEIGMPSRNEVTVTDILAVPSLERKVVIFLPGGPKLTDTEVDNSPIELLLRKLLEKSSERHSSSSALPQSSSTPPSVDKGRAADSLLQLLSPKQDPNAPSKIPVSLPTKEEIKRILFAVFGNTMVLDTKSLEEGSPASPSDKMGPADQVEDDSAKPRMGMEKRGDSPRIAEAFRNSQKTQSVEGALTSANTSPHTCADARFLVPDVGVEEGQREHELLRIRQEVSSLPMNDQDGLFMAASRCLSQLIVIVP